MSDTLYPSIAANLVATGVNRLIFRIPATAEQAPGAVPPADRAVKAWDPNTQTLLEVLQSGHALGSLAGERVSDSLLQDLARHTANPFRLAGHESYNVTNEDHNVVEWGTRDGQRCVWDQLVVPHLKDFGLSVDPGVVPPTPGRPDGGVLEQPTPIGTAADPAMKLVFALQAALLDAGEFPLLRGILLKNTDWWDVKVAPLLKGPFESS